METSQTVRLGKRKTTAKRSSSGSRQPPQPPRQPTTGGSSSAPAIPSIFRDNLQAERYELFQGSVIYVCGRNVNWSAIIHEPFGSELKSLLTNMDWIGLANITEDKYSTHLVNEFYSGILVKKSDLNLPMWNPELLYTHFNDRDFDFDEKFLGDIIDCKNYNCPSKAPNGFNFNAVWREYSVEGGLDKAASSLKSLPLRFLHHFIASTVECRSGSFNKVTKEDLWLLAMAANGQKINLARYIMDKMISTLKQKIASAKKNPPLHGKVAVPYVNILTLMARRMSRWNPRYELIKLGVKYDLASVSKMGYHKVNGIWIKKAQSVEASQEQPTTEASSGPSLVNVMSTLEQLQVQMHQRFDFVDQRLQGFQDQLHSMESKLDAYSFQPSSEDALAPDVPLSTPVDDAPADDTPAVPDLPPA